ncbi:PAS domain-containing sensor histidine kinase [Flavobacterium sp.]|uniref:PAS domain-containing sensor histidine kinase n=1 Tax=Flavobacterium sp. TaxID=239 RepID=UPI002621F2E2|nr:PAS domain-containing sensor histidine kinase [Flavobacterium sp.]
MVMRLNISIKLYLLLVLMLVVILITGIYGIRELNTLNQITEKTYAEHISISEEQFKISEEIYLKAKRNSYIFLSLSLSLFILMGIYIIRNIRYLLQKLKLTKDKAIQSEVKFQELMKYAGDSIFMTDATYQITAMNDSACQLLGYSRDELQNMKIHELMTAEDQQTFETKIKKIQKDGGSLHERTFRRKDGSFVDTEVNVRHIEGIGYISVIRDITERKEAEIKIRENDERYKSIISVSNTGGWEYHGDTGYLWCSPEYFLMLGRQQSDYDFSGAKNLQETWIELLHPEDRDRSRNHFAEYLKNGSVGMYESYFRMLHVNGSWVWIWSRGQTLRDAQGNLTQITVGTHIDITERKKAEALIKEQADIFTAIIENANEAIWLLSPDLTVLQFNKTLKERIQLNGGNEIYLGADFKDFIYKGTEKEFMRMFNEALKGNYPENELCQTNIHGKQFWIRTRMYPVYDIQKELIGIAILTENITERKTMEFERQKMTDEMLQRNRDLEQFAYIVSHNLRAPVANIMGINEYMQNTEMELEEKEEMNSGLKKSIDRLDEVIKDLNSILQMKREISEKKETVKFSDVIDNIKMSIVHLIEKEEVTFISDFTAVDEMTTIKSYLHSIFYNLISNSIKYRRPDVAPVIKIKSELIDDKIEITYKDNGLGIDLKKRGEQVFGMYKRFHTHTEGKGMGLYMVKTQVETLGGTISIKSKINKGTEFKIKFEIEKNNT